MLRFVLMSCVSCWCVYGLYDVYIYICYVNVCMDAFVVFVVRMFMHVYMNVFMCIYICMYVYGHMPAYIQIYVYVCMCICVCVCMYVSF